MPLSDPSFARDPAKATYYDQRAPEYDEWYLGQGRFADRDRPGWRDEVERLISLVAALPALRTLDVACGSAFLTRYLSGGLVVGLDQSRAMVALAQTRLPAGLALVGDALDLPRRTALTRRLLFVEGLLQQQQALRLSGGCVNPTWPHPDGLTWPHLGCWRG
ncbi:MAG: class I SAM-dependent methyltransferase [Mycobacteriales bacterium]